MAMAFPDQLLRPISDLHVRSRRPLTGKPAGFPIHFSSKPSRNGIATVKNGNKLKWALRLSLVDEERPPPPAKSGSVDVGGELVEFLYEDLPHLFDDQGIDRTMYDDRVRFRDPITKHDTIDGYLFNIRLLKLLFRPNFQLHHVKQDLWDSIEDNDYFSLEGLRDVIRQLRIYKTPDLESPKYQILKRTASYEVRKYDPFVVVETKGDKLSGSTGFNDVAGYIFGKNSTSEKIPMTTPVFTQANNSESSTISIQIVLPLEKSLCNLPDPTKEEVRLRRVEGGVAAALKFSGKPTEEIVCEKERILRAEVLRDGLKPREGCLLARYNDPGSTWSFLMRNEVLIWLKEFSMN